MYKDFYNNKLVPFVNKVRMACNVGEIPLVFDNSLTYYEQIAAFSAKLNDVISTVNVQSLTLCEFMQQLTEAFKELSDDFAEQWQEISGEYTDLSETVGEHGTDITNLDLRVTALENQPEGGIGKTIEPGTFYRIGGTESPTPPEYGDYETEDNCEVLNGYNGDAANGAAGNYSNAIGYHTRAMANYSHTEGINTIAAGASGEACHAEGNSSIAAGAAAHAEGSNTRAYGTASHAEGAGTRATGIYSHAEGSGCTASADHSHAGGAGCTASGSCSFVHGMSSNASGNNSCAIGADLIANGNEQFVCGRANEEKNSDYLFIVGNGVTPSARSNAFEVDKYGNIYLNGSTKPFRGVTVYDNSDYTITPYSATDPHVDNLNASATGYQIGDLQTVHITGSYTVYYSVSSDTGYKICEIDVPGTIDDPEKEIAAVTDYMQYLTEGSIHCLFIAKIETVNSTKKLCIYYKSAGESHGSSGINKSFDITATFKVSG